MRRRAATGERGFTLIELIVTVSILGIAFAVFLGGMSTSIIGADINRKTATSDILVRRFAEAVKNEAYVNCAITYGASFTVPSGYTKSLPAAVTYPALTGTSYVPTVCPSPPGGSDFGLQLITLRVASNDGRDRETIVIAKRKP